MKSDEAIKRLEKQIAQIELLKGFGASSPEFKRWYRDTEVAIEKIFGGSTRHLSDFSRVKYSLIAFNASTPESRFHQAYVAGLERAKAILGSMISEINEYGLDDDSSLPESDDDQALSLLKQICRQFHRACVQLRARHDNRGTLDVEDEYDVQDLLHAILSLHFDDIRPEDPVPTRAGGASRIDFLLKREQTVIEVKKSRKGLDARKLGEELIIDIERYRSHPGCKTLVCFVYDPEGRIANPRGLEADLSGRREGLTVVVIISPT